MKTKSDVNFPIGILCFHWTSIITWSYFSHKFSQPVWWE